MRTCSYAFFAALLLAFASSAWGGDFTKGQDAYNVGDYETAIAEWQPLADEGNADGQFGVGLLYANGFGVPMDDAEALKWYGLAAEQGHDEAQCNLAIMHANGWGVPQSDEEAFKWYTLAAEQGNTQAQAYISQMYQSGFGVPQDNVQAHMWLFVAAELGDFSAISKLDEVARRMTAEEIAEADTLATNWLESHPDLLANE